MPRDGSGVYTLPAGNPVVTDTVISSVWANTTLSDIAAQLNNVLTRDGLLGPVGPFKIVDGTVNAPGLAFNSQPNLGMHRPASNTILWDASGQTVFGWSADPTGTNMGIWPRAVGSAALSLYSGLQSGGASNILGFSAQVSGYSIAEALVGGATAKPLTIIFSAGTNIAGPASVSGLFTGHGGINTTAINASSVNSSGDIGATGTVTGANASFSGNAYAGGFVLAAGGTGSWTADAGAVYLSMISGWYWSLNRTNGDLTWVRNNGAGALNTVFTAGGDFLAAGNIWVGNVIGQMGLVKGGAENYLRFSSDNWRLSWVTSNGDLRFYNSGSAVLWTVTGQGAATSTSYTDAIQGYWSRLMATGQNGPNRWCFFWNNDSHLYCGVDATNQGWVQLTASDERIKKNIASLDSDTEAFMAIRPIRFQWNALLRDTVKVQAGFSAQNMVEVLPQAAVGDINSTVEEDGSIHMPASVDMMPILAHTVAQVQKLINRVNQLENP